MSADSSAGPLPPGGLNELADRLSKPEFGHPVQATDDFWERLRAGMMVHIEFTGTRGGTSLGCDVDPALSDLAGMETGDPITCVSKIKGLNGHPIRLHAQLDLKTLIGTAHIEILPGVYVPSTVQK